MGVSDYLAKRFIGKEICVALDDDDVETVIYADAWAHNKAYFHGIVIAIEDGMLELDIPSVGHAHFNCDFIKMVWEPPFSWRKAIKVSLTNKPLTPSGR